MPIDPTMLPALRVELEMAKRVKPGGQEPRPDRIAAIEEQIKLYEAAAASHVEIVPEPDSNTPTDYESHDSDAAEKAAKRGRAKKETTVATDPVEMPEEASEKAEETTVENEERETADA